MKIKRKRIRNAKKYLIGVKEEDKFHVGLLNAENYINKAIAAGFDNEMPVGQNILPNAIGRVSKFNSEGKFRIRKDLEKEQAERDGTVVDWHGNTHSVTISYLRYPREPIPAPKIHLEIKSGLEGSRIVVSPQLENEDYTEDIVCHTINLFLELFGECDILLENLIPAFNVNINRLNWKILPQGSHPWEVLRRNVDDILNTVSIAQRKEVKERIEYISSFNPDFVAIGNEGFKGYFILGFNAKLLYVLESVYSGNATYILGQEWKEISQMTKGEILNQHLHQHRLIHTRDWKHQINQILK